MSKWVPVVAVGLYLLNACAGTNGKHNYDPITYPPTPTFLWSNVSNLNSGCCNPDADIPAFAIQNYPAISFRVSRPGKVQVELLCQDSSLVGTLFDSTVNAVGWSSIHWSGHDSSGITGPKCEFLCRVTLPDSMFTISYGPRDENYPNPFSAGTVVTFSLIDSGYVSIEMFDVSGILVRHLSDSAMYPAGRHGIAWDGLGDSAKVLDSGVYFYRLFVNDTIFATKKMVLLK